MIESVKQLGVYKRKKDNLDLVDVLVEDSKLTNIDKVICLIFNITDNVDFEKVTFEDFDKRKSRKYLFRSGSSAGTNITPTAKITGDIKKTFNNRILRWFRDNSDSGEITSKIWNLFELEGNDLEKEILTQLEVKYKQLDQKQQHLLTIKIIKNEKEKYIGEFDEFKEHLKDKSKRRFSYHESKGESIGEGICVLCGEKRQVLGFASPFAFYTVDQKGFAYNFNQKASWKQLPICLDCTLDLDLGKQYVVEKLDFKLFGFRYYFIPKFVFEGAQEKIFEDIDDFIKPKTSSSITGPLLEEEQWQKSLQEEGDALSLIFLFYVKKQTRVIIKKYVEDVPPSWLRMIFVNYANLVKNKGIYQESNLKKMFGKKITGDFHEFSASWKRGSSLWSLVREFFPSSKIEGIYDKYFIDIVGDILANRTISKNIVIKALVERIRSTYRKEKKGIGNSFNFIILQSLLLYSFLISMQLINGELSMTEDIILKKLEKNINERAKNIVTFFKEYTIALNSYEKKAIFLQGVLTKFLSAVQYQNLGSDPFRTKLYGMHLDQRKLKKLLPQTIEKLREYDIAYPWLEEAIAQYMLAADNQGWQLTNHGVSYYFMVGITLGQSFKEKKEEN